MHNTKAYEKKIAELQKARDEASLALGSVLAERDRLMAEIAVLKKEKTLVADQVNALGVEKDRSENIYDQLKVRNMYLTDAINKATGLIRDQIAKIDSCNDQVTLLNTAIQKLHSILDGLKKDEEVLAPRVQAARTELESIEHKIKTKQTEYDEVKVKVEEEINKLAKERAETSMLIGDLTRRTKDLGVYEKRILRYYKKAGVPLPIEQNVL